MKEKNILLFSILIFALIGTSAFAISNYYSFTESDMKIISISTDVNVISPSTDLSSVNYIITAVMQGSGESLSGTIKSEDAVTNNGYSMEKDFTMRAGNVEEILQYPIRNEHRTIYSYEINQVDSFDECQSGDVQITSPTGWFSDDKYCVHKEEAGVKGILTSPQHSVNVDFLIDVEGESYEKTMNTVKNPDIEFEDNNGNFLSKISWNGNLYTGNPPPDKSGYVVTYSKDFSSWRVAEETKYENYRYDFSRVENKLSTMEDYNYRISDTALANLKEDINNLNSNLDDLIYSNDKISGNYDYSIDQSIEDNRNENGGTLKLVLDDKDNPIYYPEYTIKLSADWVGVNIPVGNPQITNIECPEFASGDDKGYCIVSIKNYGDSPSSVYAGMEDVPPFSQEGTSNKIYLEPSESGQVTIFINHNDYGEEITKDARFFVYDTNNPSVKNYKTTELSMTEAQYCSPNSYEPDGNILRQCKADGSGWAVVLDCNNEEILTKDTSVTQDMNGWYCKEDTNGDNNGVCEDIEVFPGFSIPDIPCLIGLFIETYKYYILGIIGFIGVSVAWFGTKVILNNPMVILFRELIGK
jgi:hypothetical protein